MGEMKLNIDLKIFSFQVPEDIKIKVNAEELISDKIHIFRLWIHSNDSITHETRALWHKELLNFAESKNSALDIARSLFYLAKTYDRLGYFDDSIDYSKKAQPYWKKLSASNPQFLENLIISYCDIAVTLRRQYKVNSALSALYEGYSLLKKNGFKPEYAYIVLLGDLGVVYEKIQDYPTSIKYYTEILETI